MKYFRKTSKSIDREKPFRLQYSVAEEDNQADHALVKIIYLL